MSKSSALIIMGVSGSGKTTIGELLAERLGWDFRDADDDHPPANVAKMKAGVPLTDEDRAPWLAILAGRIQRAQAKHQPLVLACSALKQRYRYQLAGTSDARFIYLNGSKEQIAQRMQTREHFMPSSLLDSQFDALEEPTDAIVISIQSPKEQIVDEIIAALDLTPIAPRK